MKAIQLKKFLATCPPKCEVGISVLTKDGVQFWGINGTDFSVFKAPDGGKAISIMEARMNDPFPEGYSIEGIDAVFDDAPMSPASICKELTDRFDIKFDGEEYDKAKVMTDDELSDVVFDLIHQNIADLIRLNNDLLVYVKNRFKKQKKYWIDVKPRESRKMTNKFRPFKNFAEFKKVTGCDIGTAIVTHFKKGCDEATRLIVSFDDDAYTIGLGTTKYSYKEILDNYSFFNRKTGRFEPLGIEEQEEPEKVKPAKFKVGCVYTDIEEYKYTIIAKYRDPKDKRLYIVVFDKNRGTVISEVIHDLQGNEFAYFDDFEGEFKFYAKDLISD